MKAAIAGAGNVGTHIANDLAQAGHEVLLLEQDPDIAARLRLAPGVAVVVADACEPSLLTAAGLDTCDVMVAVTGDDEDNLVSCQMAKAKFNVPRTVARLNNPKNAKIFRILGIDTTVSATAAILAQIEQELPTHTTIPLLQLKGGLEIVGMKMPPDAGVVGKRIKDLLMPHGSHVILVVGKDGMPRPTSPETILQAEDEVVAVTSPATEEALRAALTQR